MSSHFSAWHLSLTPACQQYPEQGTGRRLVANQAWWVWGLSYHRQCGFSSRNDQQHSFQQEMLDFYLRSLCRKEKQNTRRNQITARQVIFTPSHLKLTPWQTTNTKATCLKNTKACVFKHVATSSTIMWCHTMWQMTSQHFKHNKMKTVYFQSSLKRLVHWGFYSACLQIEHLRVQAHFSCVFLLPVNQMLR